MSMTCGSCGEKNRDGARFCAECGAPLERTCVTCDAPLTPTAKFCDQCGTPVGEQVPTATPPDDSAVRKTVTVVFADLVGSTAFGEAVDPETARREMAAYHQLAQRVIDRHAGTLVKFIGDGVMAVFGIPEIAEDDADRAIRAGLDLQREFAAIGAGIAQRHGAEVGLRVGINTGEIVIAEHDDDMVGDAINTAARIEAECVPGRVLVGEQTWRLTRSTVDYEVLGEVHVKGKEEGVATFQVVAATDEEIATPFVGRDDELVRLRAALDDTIDDRRARLVSIIGAPGVGKTRLAAEMSERAGEGVTAFDLRVDRAATATFGPISDLLAAVPDAIARAGAEEDADRLVPLLDTFAGTAPARSTEESFWAARRLVELIVAHGPAVIVVDDVQWAQPLFHDLLDHLVEWVDGPALIVALARPEIREIRPALAEPGRRVADVLSLEGLDAAATEQLAARLLGAEDLPAGLAERLPDSTEGNPLFVRELVRMLVDDGTITERDGTWVLAIDAEAVEVPPTIQSLLASRVERMDDDARRVVEMASVVGSEFARGAVAALVPDMARITLDRILEGLRRREVIDPTGNYWGDEPVLRFHHVLIRDAAYRRLLKERRADLHLRVADWTESMAAGTETDHDLAIAFHLEQAHGYLGELGPLDDTGHAAGTRAADLLAGAADDALQQDDLAAAGSLATRALALLDADDERRAEVLLVACEAFFQAARVNDADPLLAELVERGADDVRLGAWATAFQCHRVALTEPDALVEAEPRVAAAAETLGGLGDDAGVAKARLVRALILARLGRVGDCESELDAALHAARAAADRRRVTAVLGAAPVAALWGPSPVARAGGRCLDIIRLLRITSASPMVEATSIRCQAVLEAMRGRFDEARQLIERSSAMVDELGLRHGVLETAMYRGYIELLADDPEAAEPHLRTAYEGLGQLGVGADAGQAAAYLARALLAKGRVDEAASIAEQSDALAGQNLQTAIASRSVRAEITSHRGDHERARALAEDAVAIAATTDLTMDRATAVASLAVVEARAGNADAAARAKEQSARLFDQKGAAQSGPGEPTHPPALGSGPGITNSATEAHHRFSAAFVAGDYEAAMAFLADDWVSTDTRGGSYLHFTKAELRAFSPGIAEVPLALESDTLAVRGDRLALVRFREIEPDRSEDYLQLIELNDEGLATGTEYYEHRDLRTALDELTRRYRDGEGAEFAEMIDLAWRLGKANEATAEDQPALLAEVCHDDMVVIDHQPVVGVPDSDLSTITDEGLLDPGMVVVSEYLRIGANAIVVRSQKRLDGGLVRDHYILTTMRDGKAARMEWFAAEQRDEAIARFDDLIGSPATAELRNAASDAWRNLAKALYHDRDLAAVQQLAADGFTREDRRAVLESSVAGGEMAADFFADVLDADSPVDLQLHVEAIRGDTLALFRVEAARPGSDFVIEGYNLIETDDEGLVRVCIVHDLDQQREAVDELDARYLVDDRARFAPINALSKRVDPSLHDPQAIRGALSDDFRLIDHRGAAFGELDADGLVAAWTALEYGPQARTVLARRLLAMDESALLIDLAATDPSGNEWSVLWLPAARGDRLHRIEVWDPADLDRARARFEELTRPVDRLTNHAAELFTRFYELLLERREFDAAMALISDELEAEDRRAVVGARLGKEDLAANFEDLLGDPGATSADIEVLAVAGERLALCAVGIVREGSTFSSPFLQLIETDGSLGTSVVAFEPDDVEAATDELLARFRAGEAAEFASTLARSAQLRAAFLDPASLRAELTDDFVAVDHRQINFGTLDRDGLVGVLGQGVEMAGRRWMRVRRYLAIDHGRLLSETVVESEHESWPMLILSVDRADGTCRQELFDVADEQSALARFEELTAGPERNLAARQMERFWRLVYRELDLDAAFAMVRNGLVAVDHRRLVSSPTLTKDEVREYMELVTHLGEIEHEFELLATRGDHVALARIDAREDRGFGQEMLQLVECDEKGVFVKATSYSPEDLERARRDLAATGDRGLENQATEAARRFYELIYHDGDLAAALALIADDGVADDRRAIVNARLGKDDLAANYADILSQPGRVEESLEVISIAGERLALIAHTITREGSGFSQGGLGVWEVNEAGLLRTATFFEANDRPAAEVHFEELSSEASSTLRNSASDAIIASTAAVYDDRDIDKATAMIAESWSFEDRRALMDTTADSPEELAATYFAEVIAYDGQIEWEAEVLAVRGDRAAAVRLRFTRDGSGFGSDVIEVATVDADGRLIREIMFDAHDEAAAIAEMEAQNASETRAAPYLTTAQRAGRRLDEAQSRGDWDAFAEWIHPDAVGEDRRAGLQQTLDREAFIAATRAGAEIGLTVTGRSSRGLLTRGEHFALGQQTAGAPDGFASDALFVVEFDDDERLLRLTFFDPEDGEAAEALLDRWWLESQVPAASKTLEFMGEVNRASVNSDRAGLREMISADVTFLDHGVYLFGGFGRNEVIEAFATMFETPGGVTARALAIPRLTDRGVVIQGEIRSNDGHREWRDCAIYLLADGVLTHIEYFKEDDLATAVARFDELTTPSGSWRLIGGTGLSLQAEQMLRDSYAARDRGDWGAVRDSMAPDFTSPAGTPVQRMIYEQWVPSYNAGDWEAVRAVCAPDFVFHARRSLSRALVEEDTDDFLEACRTFADQFGAVRVEVTATRGEHLALGRFTYEGAAFPFVHLALTETDGEGRACRIATFDPEQEADAFELLNEWWVESLDSDRLRTLAVIAPFRPEAAVLRELLSDDCVLNDHRPLSYGLHLDRQVVLRLFGDDSELPPIVSARSDVTGVPRLEAAGGVVHAHTVMADGTDVDNAILMLVEGDQISRVDMFLGTDLDAAVDLFDDLTLDTAAVGNLATRQVAAVIDAVRAEHGGDPTAELIAWRGERVGLHTVTTTAPDGGRSVNHVVNQVDEGGQSISVETYDEDDFHTAQRRLHELWWADDGADARRATELALNQIDAVARGDWEGLRSLLGPGYRRVMHRQLNFADEDADSFVQNTKVWSELGGEVRSIGREILGATTDVLAVVAVFRLTDPTGLETEWPSIILFWVANGQVVRQEEFDPEDLDAAVARFHELAAEGAVASRHGGRHEVELVSRIGETARLHTVTTESEAGERTISHVVTHVDSKSRVGDAETFDEAEFHAAQRRAIDLWLDREAPEAKPVMAALLDLTDAFAVEDWDAIGDLLAPDFQIVVSKPLSTEGTQNATGFMANMQVWTELSGSIRVVLREVVAATAQGCVLVNDVYTTDDTGMVSQWSSAMTLLVADGKLTHWEEFEPDDVDAALARFEELTSDL